jgi:hypothetical protein
MAMLPAEASSTAPKGLLKPLDDHKAQHKATERAQGASNQTIRVACSNTAQHAGHARGCQCSIHRVRVTPET